jgi:hypothetical protein
MRLSLVAQQKAPVAEAAGAFVIVAWPEGQALPTTTPSAWALRAA